MATPNETRYDVRLIEQRIRRGTVSADEYAKHLAALPDEAAEAEPSKVHFVPSYADRYGKR
jgi:hypothetical protein